METNISNLPFLLLWTFTLWLTWASVAVRSETPRIAILSWQLEGSLMRVKPECDSGTAPEAACKDQTTFSLDLIRMTRLFNPSSQTRFLLLLDALPYMENPYYRSQIERSQVEVRARSQFRESGSRAIAYDTVHARFGLRHWATMMSRFCEWADLAKAENLTRVLTLDSDVALFDNVDKIFGQFTEDVVVPCTWCSQNVLWSVKALDKFCDGLIDFWSQPADQIFQNAIKYHLVKEGKEGWNDMVFLDIWLRNNWGGHNLTWISLTASGQPSPLIPHPGVWMCGVSVQMAYPTMMDPNDFHPSGWHNLHCEHFWELFAFRPSGNSVIPLPTHIPSGVTFPLLHFHQKCKMLVVDPVYKKYYRQFFDAIYP